MIPARPPTFYLLLASGPFLLVLGLAARLLPPGLQPMCLLHRLTGFPCAGCGSYRALALFSAGHWPEAFLMQPLMTLFFSAALAGSAAALVAWLLRKPLPDPPLPVPRTRRLLIAMTILLVLANWLYLIKAGR